MRNRQRIIEDDADIKFRNETPQQQIEDRDNRSEERFDSLEKRVRVLEKNEKNRQSELDRLIRNNAALLELEVVQDYYTEGEVKNIRCDREIALEPLQQWNDSSLEVDSMQSSSATTCREEYSSNRCYKKLNPTKSQQRRHATRKTSNSLTACQKEKLSMLQRDGTVC